MSGRPDERCTGFVDPGDGAVLTVDLAALRANYVDLRRMAQPARCAGVVKADGYGLGLARVARTLADAGCDLFFVATLSEGVELRTILGSGPEIAVLNGVGPGCEHVCLASDLMPVLNSLSDVERWRQVAASYERPLAVHLQFDTGMSRLGLGSAEAKGLSFADLRSSLDIRLLLTHLACASDPADVANAEQFACFAALAVGFPGIPRSLAASSGMFLGKSFHCDVVRPGAALYGLAPVGGMPNPMRPVVRLQARVLQTRSVPGGTRVGYGLAGVTVSPTRLATVAMGYADGLPRSGNGAVVWFRGHRLPIVGRVSMDSIVVDAGGAPVDVGDLVDIIGPDADVDALAAAAGTIGYEILTGLGQRLERRYLDVEEMV